VMPIVDFINQSYESRSRDTSVISCINMYPQQTGAGSKSPVILVGTPGTKTFTREVVVDRTIASIQGDGSPINVVTVTTTLDHNYAAGQIINITNTSNYNQDFIEIKYIVNSTTFTYETLVTTSSLAETAGDVETTGESPILGIPIDSPCKGIHHTSTGRLFAVFSNNLYEIYSDGKYEAKGASLGISPNDVSMADDGKSLVIVNGFEYYVFDLDLETSQVVDTFATAGFRYPSKVVAINGRIVIINNDRDENPGNPGDVANDNKFYWSDILNAAVIDPLSFASAETSFDPIIGMVANEDDLWLFGPNSYEVWRVDGNLDLPFSFVGGTGSQIGCGAPKSITTIGNQVFWVGSSTAGDGIVYMSQGYSAQRISNHAVEYQLAKMVDTSDCVGFTYQQEGHVFYIMNFIQGNKTFVYDLTTGLFHERSTREIDTNNQNVWAPRFATYAFGNVIVGDSLTARLFTLDLDRYLEYDGRPLVREFVSPIYHEDYREVIYKEFQIDFESGQGIQFGLPNTGIQQGQGTDPQVMLQYSNNAGRTWSSERWTSMGKIGEYQAKARWRMLGRSAKRVFRIMISDPVKVCILGARIITEVTKNR